MLESPFAADTEAGILENIEYARACVRDCILRGEAPFASHLLYTQTGVLRDEIADERALGMKCGFAWGNKAQACVVYTDRGISRGMRAGIARAIKNNIPVEYRELGAIAPKSTR